MNIPEHEQDSDEDDPILPQYRPQEEIETFELRESLVKLAMFAGDPYLSMQAANVSLIDKWLLDLEKDVQLALRVEERTPGEAMFLSAVTQMWIFAIYELMRTWRQRAEDTIKLAANGGLSLKIRSLDEEIGYQHTGREIRAKQLREVEQNPELIVKVEEDLRRTHALFRQLEFLRVALAKHEVAKRKNMIAMAPGYGRINEWTGSLVYELSSGNVILDYISRRDIADAIRAIEHDNEPPTSADLDKFDKYMKGFPLDSD